MTTKIAEVLERMAKANPSLTSNINNALESISSVDNIDIELNATAMARAICSRYGIAIDDPNDVQSLMGAFASALIVLDAAINASVDIDISAEDEAQFSDLTDDEVIALNDFVASYNNRPNELYSNCNSREFWAGIDKRLRPHYAQAFINLCSKLDKVPSDLWIDLARGKTHVW